MQEGTDFMKNKKIAAILLTAVLSASLLAGCGNIGNTASNSGNAAQNQSTSAGGKTQAADFDGMIKEETGKLEDCPEVREAYLKLGNSILEKGIAIESATYNGYDEAKKLMIIFGRGDFEKPDQYLEIFYNNQEGEWALRDAEAHVCDKEMSDQVAGCVQDLTTLTEEERELIFNLEYADDIYTENYWMCYEEQTTSSGTNFWSLQINHLDYEVSPSETTLVKIQRSERKANAPTADGTQVDLDYYGVSYYVPSAMKANEYNGMLGVYDFYTGEYVGTGVTGVDINLRLGSIDGDMSLEEYVRTESSPAKYGNITDFEAKELNGSTWWVCSQGEHYYYASENLGCLYEFDITGGQDFGVTLAELLEMFEETVYLY